jgi:prepilin-type N-terminal cleavage/methylation domain-containing protein
MWKPKYQSYNKGFTFTELLVTIGIIAALAGIGTIAVVKIRGTTNQVTCMNNMKTISNGLQLHYNDYKVFPDDGYPDDTDDQYPLAVELSDYIDTNKTFICPLDKDQVSIDNLASYDPFYVKRTSAGQTEKVDQLAIGCPRHRDNDSSTSLFSTGYTEITKVGTTLANGQEIPPDGDSNQRKISNVNDVMTFDDGSAVTITNAVANYNVFLTQSVRLSDGTLYSIIRIQGDGTINTTVTSGSKFEVVTPSAIVGVRGTVFTVQTSNGGATTDVTIITGKVVVIDRASGETNTLESSSAVTEATVDKNEHDHYHWHADGTYHSHAHPGQKNAHHGTNDGKKKLVKLEEKQKKWGSGEEEAGKVVVCHLPGTNDEETKEISQGALAEHLAHGDSLGACPGVSENYVGWKWKKWWKKK